MKDCEQIKLSHLFDKQSLEQLLNISVSYDSLLFLGFTRLFNSYDFAEKVESQLIKLSEKQKKALEEICESEVLKLESELLQFKKRVIEKLCLQWEKSQSEWETEEEKQIYQSIKEKMIGHKDDLLCKHGDFGLNILNKLVESGLVTCLDNQIRPTGSSPLKLCYKQDN